MRPPPAHPHPLTCPALCPLPTTQRPASSHADCMPIPVGISAFARPTNNPGLTDDLDEVRFSGGSSVCSQKSENSRRLLPCLSSSSSSYRHSPSLDGQRLIRVSALLEKSLPPCHTNGILTGFRLLALTQGLGDSLRRSRPLLCPHLPP